ncbi:indolepyruvate ferredoxin oxidoreductase subunit alpha [Spirochaetota bacterium]|nr:indolepyruvate ferredoxin oxidoreductase subunit alpha [Spirochaetota bacterium]
MSVFCSGNEAIALALHKAHTSLVVGYPGTPSTEIIETLKKNSHKKQLATTSDRATSKHEQKNSSPPPCKAHWCINEKVAFEMALGAALSGARAAVTMKHVGLNVAADPLMTSAYAGVNGGFVIITADDPNMYSSQNEQDNRNYALFAKLPMLEPSDGNEAYLFTQLAFIISEKFNTPVILRVTMRICHSYETIDTTQTASSLLPPTFPYPPKETTPYFDKTTTRTIMLPDIARNRHSIIETRLPKLAELNSLMPINHFIKGHGTTLLITAGIAYHYILESFKNTPILKLGMTYPLPISFINRQLAPFEEIIVVEELDPFLERELLVNGIPYAKLRKRSRSFYLGELSPERTSDLVLYNKEPAKRRYQNPAAAPNPPRMCSGCPHLTIANLLRDLDLTVSGDIGCYTLAALAPFESLHTVIDMGASIPIMLGMQLASSSPVATAKQTTAAAKIAVIGDSTFLHSGITGLIEARYLSPNGVICLLDNRTTAMTGQQSHAGIGDHPFNPTTHPIDYKKLAEVIGIKNTHKCDPYDLKTARAVLSDALAEPGISFVIFERACALIKSSPPPTKEKNTPLLESSPLAPTKNRFDPKAPPPPRHLITPAEVQNNCVRCGECLNVGCPSITFSDTLGRPTIDKASCIGCGICLAVCEYDALTQKHPSNLLDLVKLEHS